MSFGTVCTIAILICRLAATLGAKSTLKKLQKKDILSVDVPRACTFLSDADESLALRLSSNLMYGVIRVFSQQYNFFYGTLSKRWLRSADVNVMHTRIRRETFLFNALNTGASLDESSFKVSPKKYSPQFVLTGDPSN